MELPEPVRADAEVLWAYLQVDDPVEPVDVAVGLGSHDPGVPAHTAELYRRGLFPLVVFTGASGPSTVDRFPHGEAVHFREIALDSGVPAEAVLVEARARNTGENLRFTRDLLADRGIAVRSVLLVARPYHQRRARATAAKVWPEVAVLCSAHKQDLGTYLAEIGDADRVVSMLVGEVQRVAAYPERGFTVVEEIPGDVWAAYERLVAAGYTRRLTAR